MSRYRQLVASFVVALLVIGCGKAKLTKLEQAKQLLHQKDHAQALKLCNELLTDPSNNYEAMLLRGQINESLGSKAEAMADFTKAIEIAPTRSDAYAFRFRLNSELAEQEPDSERAAAFEQAAIEDHRNYLRLSPSAADIAGLSSPGAKLESLSKPIPGLDQSLDQPFDQPVDDDPLANAQSLPEQAHGEVAETQPNAADSAPVEEPTPTPTQTATEKWLAKRAESLKKIQELDLRDPEELLEPTLPPHLDPTQPELIPPDVPAPLITRFDLPPDAGFRPATRRKRRPTTGILQLPDDQGMAPDAKSFQYESGAPISPFLNPSSSFPSTGIVSGRSPQDGSARDWQDRQRELGMMTGLWAPWTPQAPLPGERAKSQDEDTPPAPPSKPAQVLSMAIPGTSPSTRSGLPTGNRLVPAPWEEGYLPFKPRPTGFVVPTFNDRSSASR